MKKLWVSPLLASAVISLAPASARPAAPAWQSYRDAASHFSLSYPTGWKVRRDRTTIVVADSNGDSQAVIYGFSRPSDEPAPQSLNRFTTERADLVHSGFLQDVQPQSVASGQEVTGTIHFQTPHGAPGTARALCLVSGERGFIFLVAAPSARFSAEAPRLQKILTSFRIDAGPIRSASAAPPSQRGLTVDGLKYVPWTDPHEHAFGLQVPQGWLVSGGLYRFGSSDARTMVMVTSPDREVTVMDGDPNVPLFTVPTQMHYRMGLREGQQFSPVGTFKSMLANYLPAPQFNRLYIEKSVARLMTDVRILEEHDMPERVAQMGTSDPSGMPIRVTACRTDFSCKSPDGRSLLGFVATGTRMMGGISWIATPVVCIYSNDAEAAAHQAVGLAVTRHMQSTTATDPSWMAEQRSRTNRFIRQSQEELRAWSEASARAAQEKIAETGRRAKADHEAQMAGYERHNANWRAGQDAKAHAHENFMDFVFDRTTVSNPSTGQTLKVSNQSSYHYQTPGGTVVGTNSNYAPPANWTPLVQVP